MQRTFTLLIGLLVFLGISAQAGHELPYYPSFYPQEIRIEAVDPHLAATRLSEASLHAYIGSEPLFQEKKPKDIQFVESLGSYLLVTINSESQKVSEENRCTVGRNVVASLAKREHNSFIFYPYPVTPYHPDYLQHFDLVEAAKQAYQGSTPDLALLASYKISVQGKVAEDLLSATQKRTSKDGWDIRIEEIEIKTLLDSASLHLNGWFGPPWLKQGWFHAYLLWSNLITDDQSKRRLDSLYQSLIRGDYTSLVERINMERQLVSLLSQRCERIVAGYTVRREYYNAEYSAGVENTASDSLTGFYSPLFLRTVKLKDFPWNGWLRLGVETKPASAWNPLGGFTDTPGQLIWFAISDPGFLPAPNSGHWLPNRVQAEISSVESSAGQIKIPRDAVLPEPGSGLLRGVGEEKTARTKITYRIFPSLFHDKSRMTIADLLYSYIFSFRWGTLSSANQREYDPVIAQASALLRDHLVGLKVLRIEKETRTFGELQIVFEIPVIEVYVDYPALPSQQVTTLAPPWSSLPWHVMVLMEEAVKRGWAAFSQEEAHQRGVVWLDLVRDQQLKDRLASLVEEFAAQGYLPEALGDLVTREEAKARWTALQKFFQTYDHFLVTNGPYLLQRGFAGGAVLEVFRDLSYPLGVGTFDKYVFPPRAFNVTATFADTTLELRADVEHIEKAMRDYIPVQEPLRHDSMTGVYQIVSVVEYVVLDAQGQVVLAGASQAGENRVFTVNFTGKLSPGLYTILTALYLNDNYTKPEVKRVTYRVNGGS